MDNCRNFGIEIECFSTCATIVEMVVQALQERGVDCTFEGYSHEVVDRWKIVTDSSIKGSYAIEVVSPILRGRKGLQQLRRVLAVLRGLGCQVNYSCGIHVHHEVKDFNLEALKSVFAYYKAHELIIDSIVARSRRGNNSYCKSLLFSSDEFPKSRYSKLNYQSFAKYGTIEFRQHQGSLSFSKVLNWIEFTQAIALKAQGANEAPSLEKMLKILGLENKTSWFLERANELN